MRTRFRLRTVDRTSIGQCPLTPIPVVLAGTERVCRPIQPSNARPAPREARASKAAIHRGSDFGLLRVLQRIVDLNAQISDRRFQLRVAEKKLHCEKILGPLVDQSSLGPAHRMAFLPDTTVPTHESAPQYKQAFSV